MAFLYNLSKLIEQGLSSCFRSQIRIVLIIKLELIINCQQLFLLLSIFLILVKPFENDVSEFLMTFCINYIHTLLLLLKWILLLIYIIRNDFIVFNVTICRNLSISIAVFDQSAVDSWIFFITLKKWVSLPELLFVIKLIEHCVVDALYILTSFLFAIKFLVIAKKDFIWDLFCEHVVTSICQNILCEKLLFVCYQMIAH